MGRGRAWEQVEQQGEVHFYVERGEGEKLEMKRHVREKERGCARLDIGIRMGKEGGCHTRDELGGNGVATRRVKGGGQCCARLKI